jgi:ribosomal protein L32E
VAESELLAAQDALNKAQYDSSVSQKQMDALKKKAEEARVKVLNLRNELAQTV